MTDFKSMNSFQSLDLPRFSASETFQDKGLMNANSSGVKLENVVFIEGSRAFGNILQFQAFQPEMGHSKTN